MRFFHTVLLLLISICVYASGDILVGRIIDKDTGEPIPDVSFSVEGKNAMGGTVTMRYANNRTDSLGRFKIYTVLGETTITFSYIGYHDAKYTRMGGADTTHVDIGDVKMRMDALLLKSVTVKAKRKQFYMRGDTVIYDPQAFNLKSGDRIAKLISRLPGVTVDEFGSLSWLGNPVRMILNGRENPIASTFLSQVDAEAVENIKVYNKSTDNWGDTLGVNEYYKVLDVRIKPSWMERWYGETGVSGQTNRYYGMLGTAYSLSDKVPMQVGISMSDGDGVYDVSRYSKERIQRDKTTIVRSQQLRVDYGQQPVIYTGKKSLRAKAYIDHSDKRKHSESNSEEYLSDGEIKYKESTSSSYRHNLQITPLNFIFQRHKHQGINWTAEGQITFYKRQTDLSSAEATFKDNPYELENHPLNKLLISDNALADIALNSNMEKRHINSHTLNSYAEFTLSIPLDSKLRFNSSLFTKYDSNSEKDYSTRITNYYVLTKPLSQIDRQYSSTPSHDFQYSLETGLTKNTGDFNFNISYINSLQNSSIKKARYRLLQDDSIKRSFLHEFDYAEDIPIEMYEYDWSNSKYKNQTDLGNEVQLSSFLRKGKHEDEVTVRMSISSKYLYQRMHYRRGIKIDTIAHRDVLLPNVDMKISKAFNGKLTVALQSSFNKSATDFEHTIGYTDDTNPLYIVQGNPKLRNYAILSNGFQSFLNLPEKQIMASLFVALTQIYDGLASKVYYNSQTGSYRERYDNAPGGHAWSVRGTFDLRLSPKANLKVMPYYQFQKNYRYLTIKEDNPEYVLNTQRLHNLTNDINLRWYNDICELKLFANISLRKYNNTEGAYSHYTYFDYNIGMGSSVEVCPTVTAGLDVSLNGKNGYLQADMNKDRWLMDASIAIRMLRGKGTLTLSAIDILRQQTHRSYNVTASSRSETRTYGLTDYYMLSFSYMFGKPKGQ